MEHDAEGSLTARAIVVMGVSACGKSAVGKALAQRLDFDFVDGDDLHPPNNVVKMSSGTPLTDEDRWPWLDRVGGVLRDRQAHPRGLVTACSALRRSYRDRIRSAAGHDLAFVFLDITRVEATRRIAVRRGHFMPISLIDSQFATLERPEDEPDVLAVSNVGSIDETVGEAVRLLDGRPEGAGVAG